MSWGIDKIQKIRFFFSLIVEIVFIIHGNSGGFNGDSSFFLVLSGIGISGFSSVFGSDNSGFGDKGIG